MKALLEVEVRFCLLIFVGLLGNRRQKGKFKPFGFRSLSRLLKWVALHSKEKELLVFI